ncbi:hypothetical protein ACL03H_17330 [Saccharopolyspora sp. MS10]|uniref:hypothetical protein n=1 Tax=Saccharopolyspora sp. MS10 TaxID=3385973 RepID=UPI0039A03D09
MPGHEELAARAFLPPGDAVARLREVVYDQLGLPEPAFPAIPEPVVPHVPRPWLD